MQDKEDVLARAYSRLVSLRDALSGVNVSELRESYVHEYHEALAKLSRLGIDVDEFRVPRDAMRRQETSQSYMGNAPTTYGDSYVDRAFLLSKLGAVIGYFEMSQSPNEKRPIGFRA